MSWQDEYSEQFKEKLDSKEFRSLRGRIYAKCALLRQSPYGAAHSERLRYDLSGKRSARVDKRVRLIFTVCEECIREHLWPNRNNCCDDPSVRNPNTIVFLDIWSHYGA